VPDTASHPSNGQEAWSEVTTREELEATVGPPIPRVAGKVRASLHEMDKVFLAASPFCVLATVGSDGSCNASPRGDPPGSLRVLDDCTIVLPDRPGNRRFDAFHDVLTHPRVGLLVVVPGRGDTLRVNGSARLVRDAPFFDDLVVAGHRPGLALVVHVEEVFMHCSKAFLRAGLWDPATWAPDVVPSRARIAQALERQDESLEELERYYGPGYPGALYGS